MKNRSDFWAPKVPPPQKASPCDGKPLAIAIFLRFLRGKERPNCGLAGDRDACDRKSWRFTIASFGALSSPRPVSARVIRETLRVVAGGPSKCRSVNEASASSGAQSEAPRN